MFVEGVLWILHTGSSWRDLPEAIGDWNSVLRRFNRSSIKDVWWRILEAMSDDPDFKYLIVDPPSSKCISTLLGRKKRSEDLAIGRSRGGLSTKTHTAVRRGDAP